MGIEWSRDPKLSK